MTLDQDTILRMRYARRHWHEVNTPRPQPTKPVDYRTYLDSDDWLVFRESVLAAYDHTCCECCSSLGVLQVHHLHYHTLGWEDIDDVVVLCRDCHAVADRIRQIATTARRHLDRGARVAVKAW